LSRSKKVLHAFDVAACITNAYSASHTAINIISGFIRTGLLDSNLLIANIEPWRKLFDSGNVDRDGGPIVLHNLLHSFCQHGRSLLRDADVEDDASALRIGTRKSPYLTSDKGLEALQERDNCRHGQKRSTRELQNCTSLDHKESPEAIRRLVALSAQRHEVHEVLDSTRAMRRARQRALIRRKCAQ